MDDTCAPDFLEEMVGALESVKSGRLSVGGDRTGSSASHSPQSTVHSSRPIDVAVCGFDVIDEDGNVQPDHPAARWPKRFYGEWLDVPHVRDGRTEFLLHACLGIVWWTISAVVFRRSLLDRIGLFRTDRGSQADEEWEMRAALASDIVYVPENLATWRVHGEQATANLRQMNRTNLVCLESVLRDENSGILAAWKQVGGWQREITRVCRTEYCDSFGLYRSAAREAPGTFLRGIGQAARNEPLFLVQQVLNGFSWSARMSPDPIAAAHALIELFGASWPPRGESGR